VIVLRHGTGWKYREADRFGNAVPNIIIIISIISIIGHLDASQIDLIEKFS